MYDQLGSHKDFTKDVNLLMSQVNRCNDILKKLTLNPIINDDFIAKNLSISNYVSEIIKSFEEISKKIYSQLRAGYKSIANKKISRACLWNKKFYRKC